MLITKCDRGFEYLKFYEELYGLPDEEWLNGKAAQIQEKFQSQYSGLMVWCNARTGIKFRMPDGTVWVIWDTFSVKDFVFSAVCVEGDRKGEFIIVNEGKMEERPEERNWGFV